MSEADFVSKIGDVAGFVRERDWSKTSLGTPSTWPGSLRTVLRLMLASRYAMWMGYGKELNFFYNDAYAQETLGAPSVGARQADARGVGRDLGPDRATYLACAGHGRGDVRRGAPALPRAQWLPGRDLPLVLVQPCPRDAAGEIASLFCVVVEETSRIINERRLAFLRDLSALLAAVTAPEDVGLASVFAMISLAAVGCAAPQADAPDDGSADGTDVGMNEGASADNGNERPRRCRRRRPSRPARAPPTGASRRASAAGTTASTSPMRAAQRSTRPRPAPWRSPARRRVMASGSGSSTTTAA